MNFINGVKNELNDVRSETENGALQYSTSGRKMLDMFFNITAYRNKSTLSITDDFVKVYSENPQLAIKFLFYIGDIREGIGERRFFQTILTWLGDSHPEIVKNIVKYIGEYNRFDALLSLFNTVSEKIALTQIAIQLKTDLVNLNKEKPISLLAKWLPSINTSSKVSVKQAKKIVKFLHISEKEYRITLSRLRKYLDIVEKKMAKNDWSEIDYTKVPSKANLLYKNCFIKHDAERRNEYIAKLAKGETTINSTTCFPHDIVHKYFTGSTDGYATNLKYDQVIESMWESLKNTVDPNKANKILVVRDGSGSMVNKIDNKNSSVTAEEVATALSIYFAERQTNSFKNKFITFSDHPEIVDMSKLSSLKDKLELCYHYDDCANTDIEKTLKLVLNVAIHNHLKQEEIPSLLIISDMEFDSAVEDSGNIVLFKEIDKQFKLHGYTLPKIIFWRVTGRTGGIPLKESKNGVILVSGFSTSIVNMILSDELDPYKALLKVLLSERYSKINIK